jgi:DNA-binding CsgD family transcriptional regulator
MLTNSEQCGDTYYREMAAFGRAVIEVEFGDVAVAAEQASRALRSSLEADSHIGAAYIGDTLAWVADRQGDHRRAATLFGIAAAFWQTIGASPDVAALPHRAHVDSSRQALGAELFDQLHERGRAMSVEEVTRFALGADDAPAERPADGRLYPLTRRETEIAELVAEGLTNRQIGAKLVISLRTADTHVQHILTKLDLTNRAQIAAWITSRAPSAPRR